MLMGSSFCFCVLQSEKRSEERKKEKLKEASCLMSLGELKRRRMKRQPTGEADVLTLIIVCLSSREVTKVTLSQIKLTATLSMVSTFQ